MQDGYYKVILNVKLWGRFPIAPEQKPEYSVHGAESIWLFLSGPERKRKTKDWYVCNNLTDYRC
jgi:hypothetical protein